MDNEAEYAYSIDEEQFMSIDEIVDILEDDEEIETVYKGVMVPKTHKDFLHGYVVIEDICNQAYEEFSEFSEGYIDDLENGKHTENITKLILEYLDKNASQPGFYGINKIVEINRKDLL